MIYERFLIQHTQVNRVLISGISFLLHSNCVRKRRQFDLLIGFDLISRLLSALERDRSPGYILTDHQFARERQRNRRMYLFIVQEHAVVAFHAV